MSEELERPRQGESTLLAALAAAERELRQVGLRYRDPQNRACAHIDKKVRKALAASYLDWSRLLADHIAALSKDTRP